ncbi:MAG: DUF6326 family protein [Chloroflexota bacterium]
MAWILPYRINRWANIIAGIIGLGFVFITQRHDLDDIFFAGVQVLTAFVIIWLAWTWREQQA